MLTLLVSKPCVSEVLSQLPWSCNDLYQPLTCASLYLPLVSLTLQSGWMFSRPVKESRHTAVTHCSGHLAGRVGMRFRSASAVSCCDQHNIWKTGCCAYCTRGVLNSVPTEYKWVWAKARCRVEQQQMQSNLFSWLVLLLSSLLDDSVTWWNQLSESREKNGLLWQGKFFSW